MTDVKKIEEETGIKIDHECIPAHIAIIMDGNGRWATKQDLPRILGHERGHEVLRDIIRACDDLGIKVLTTYAFSTENWRRPKKETQLLMELIAAAAREEQAMMMENNIRMYVSGRLSELPPDTLKSLSEDIRVTSKNTGLILNLAVNYGGRQEILDAAQEACRRVKEGLIAPEDITEEYFSNLMYTSDLPDPDLLIRTAGEMRISNFLLWEIAYSELWVTSTLWPEFSRKDLMTAILDYQKRSRKFGAVIP